MSIAPMPLAPFEHLMLADDCPENPMSFFIQMKFQGRFDRARLNAALKKALALHPLLNSRIQGSAKDSTSRITWIEASSPTPAIDWNDANVPIRFAIGRWLDLRSETGIRLWLRESEKSTTLILQIHHSCCDGIGAVSFIHTLLMAYHLPHTSTSTSALEEMTEPRLLQDRDQSFVSWRHVLRMAWHAIFRISQYAKTQPVPLATPRAVPADISGGDLFPRFQTITFGEAETEQLRVTAKQLGVSLNDLLLRDLFLILDQWNRRHSLDHRSQPIRVCVPINLRQSADRRMSAANVLSLSFLDRDANQLADPIGLLDNLHAQTKQTKRSRKFLVFLPAIKLLGMFPGRLYARMKRTHCLNSAVLSNLGILWTGSPLLGLDRKLVSAGLTLESIEAVVPLRPLTHAAFFALNYGGKLSLTISHDKRWINNAEALELLQSYVRQLRDSLSSPDELTTNDVSDRQPSGSVAPEVREREMFAGTPNRDRQEVVATGFSTP